MVLAARHRMFPFVSSRDSDFDSSDRWEFGGEFNGGFDGEFDPVHPSDVVSSSAANRVADVSDGGVVFVEAFAPLDSKLRSLHRRIVSAVVRGEPMPVACETLPEIDHLLARIETAWNENMREGSRRDPDPEQWSRCLLAATEACFTAWCFACLCELSGGGLIQIDAGGSIEAWVADEPILLAEDLATALDGARIDLVVDPLRRPEITGAW